MKFLRGFGFAFSGLKHAFRTQINFKFHCATALCVGLLALWMRVSTVEAGLLVFTIGSVLSAELFNTAMEAVVDIASPQHNGLARIAKDCAAAAVLVCALVAALVGALVFLPHLAILVFGSE